MATTTRSMTPEQIGQHVAATRRALGDTAPLTREQAADTLAGYVAADGWTFGCEGREEARAVEAFLRAEWEAAVVNVRSLLDAHAPDARLLPAVERENALSLMIREF